MRKKLKCLGSVKAYKTVVAQVHLAFHAQDICFATAALFCISSLSVQH